jgi:hypothetical protein
MKKKFIMDSCLVLSLLWLAGCSLFSAVTFPNELQGTWYCHDPTGYYRTDGFTISGDKITEPSEYDLKTIDVASGHFTTVDDIGAWTFSGSDLYIYWYPRGEAASFGVTVDSDGYPTVSWLLSEYHWYTQSSTYYYY